MIQNCNEQLLNDVVRVDLVPASECNLPIPCQVALTEMTVPNLDGWQPNPTAATPSPDYSVIGQARLSVAYSVEDGDDGIMESAPKLKQTPKTAASRLLVSHDLQVPVVAGFAATEEAASLLHRRDFHVVLTTADGERYLIYALPNTCEVLLPQNEIRQDGTLKIAVTSASHVILLK